MNSFMIDGDSTSRGTEDVVLEIVGPVADAEGADPTELPPLYDAIDPEVLSELRGANVALEFTYHGYEIVVDRDGEITVTEGDG